MTASDPSRETDAGFGRARFCLAWLLLVLCMGGAAAVVAFLPPLLEASFGGRWYDPSGWPLAVAVVCAVTVLVAPFYLSRLDTLLAPRRPIFRPGYLAYVAGPGLPFAAPMIAAVALRWPAYPMAYVYVPAAFYEVTVFMGALLFVMLARPLGLFGHTPRATPEHDARVLAFFAAWLAVALSAVFASFLAGVVLELAKWLADGPEGAARPRGPWRPLAFAGAGMTVAAIAGPILVLFRARLVNGTFPFLAPGYAVMAVAPIAFAALIALRSPETAVEAAVLLEGILLLASMTYVVIGRRCGLVPRKETGRPS